MAIVGVAVFLLSRSSVGESVKRESAQLFKYEYIPNQNVKIDSTEAARGADSIYKDFRNKFRFHYQTIGMASFGDSSRMILLSDIPPHFETDSIAPIFAKFTHKYELRRHRIGYDGYTTDVVLVLGNATAENCDKLISRLNREMFFSDYKPVVMPLPAEHRRRYFAAENIDYQITLDEFNTWFMEEGEGFVRLEDTNTVITVGEMFDRQLHGVFFSQQPGFVAWALPKNSDLADTLKSSDIQTLKQSIRQFTLDADLILGAIADSGTLVVIGRERQSPLYELPPLQIESILLLASTTEKELSQSLDVNDLMAGKMMNGKDWCPTYLSKELENTEFGDLMTITDVLLKDWSERGTIQEGYYRYPEPGYYPFDRPLFRKLGLNELVYNWNTAGAMYAIDCLNVPMPDCFSADAEDTQTLSAEPTAHHKQSRNNTFNYTVYTLGRTGSLPVSYFNSQERSQSIGYRYESQAYHYFATLGNTDLARVVQYTALYQLFVDNNICYSGNTYPSFPKNKPYLLCKPTTELLNIIKNLGEQEIAALADSLSQRSFNSYQKEQVDKQMRNNEERHNFTYSDANRDMIYNNVHRDTKANFTASLREVKSMLNGLSEEKFNKLARYLSYPRGVKINDRESYNTMLQGRRVNNLLRIVGKNNLDLFGMDLNNVKNWYAASLKANSGRYMKTSSLIVTFNDMLTTGGHNLSSRINRVNSMSNYKRSRGGYSPTDYPKQVEKKPDGNAAPAGTAAPDYGTKPSVKNPDGKTNSATKKPATGTLQPAIQKPSATQPSRPKGGQSVRPRSAVISNAPRTSRGFY